MNLILNHLSHWKLENLYKLSDWVLYPLIYHIIRYRRHLVRTNLTLSFPEKSAQEIIAIEKRFYHHFADVIVEILWSYSATEEEMKEHIHFENVEDIENWAEQKGGVFFMLGHFGNWEWTADIQHRFRNPSIQHYNVYRKQSNQATDRMMTQIREKRSGQGSCIEKNSILRRLLVLKKENKLFTLGLISDQKVQPQNAYHRTTFLHQDTTFLGGGEVLGTKFDCGITYIHILKTERGKYSVRIDLITTTPQQENKFYITEQFARRLEENIREQPELWLWTHNRWKWERMKQ